MTITLDKQVGMQECPECKVPFTAVRGSVFGDGEPIGLYLIGLHGHSPEGLLAHLAIALLDRSGGESQAFAAAMTAIAMPDQFGFKLVDWEASPWRGETYLGDMLNPSEVRASRSR
ncbi:MAG: hypothetical protein J2P46_11175, partial [Zavarzinella sp.]|nr:hypothetical protein [Zavarzinella sp.]